MRRGRAGMQGHRAGTRRGRAGIARGGAEMLGRTAGKGDVWGWGGLRVGWGWGGDVGWSKEVACGCVRPRKGLSVSDDRSRAATLARAEARAAVFAARAAEIGLSKEQAAAYAAAVEAAREALAAQEAARSAAMAATAAAVERFAELRGLGADLVRLVRAFAEASGSPAEVYELAQIPAPAPRSPAPPPARPAGLRVELDPTRGALTLSWKATHPKGTSGTSYIVRRRLPGEDGFAFLGTTGSKRFVDETLPAGAEWAQYTVQAQRADSAGPVSAIFTAHMGRAEPTPASHRLAA